MAQLQFTQDFATKFLPQSLARIYPSAPRQPVTALEIGSFEGLGTRLIFTHLIVHHPESKLYCVDPWLDVYVPGKATPEWDACFVGQFERFVANTADLGARVVPIRGMSNDVVPTLREPLDFAYIDGDHSPEQVYRDAAMVAPLMRKDAVMLFDDYPWTLNGVRTGDGVDRWIAENHGKIDVLFIGYQAAVRFR
jgi:hypothetical protein